MTSCAEIVGKLSAGVLITKVGLKPVLFGAFFTAAVGTVFLIFFPNADEIYISLFLLVTRFGASMAIVGASLGTVLITPT